MPSRFFPWRSSHSSSSFDWIRFHLATSDADRGSLVPARLMSFPQRTFKGQGESESESESESACESVEIRARVFFFSFPFQERGFLKVSLYFFSPPGTNIIEYRMS